MVQALWCPTAEECFPRAAAESRCGWSGSRKFTRSSFDRSQRSAQVAQTRDQRVYVRSGSLQKRLRPPGAGACWGRSRQRDPQPSPSGVLVRLPARPHAAALTRNPPVARPAPWRAHSGGASIRLDSAPALVIDARAMPRPRAASPLRPQPRAGFAPAMPAPTSASRREPRPRCASGPPG